MNVREPQPEDWPEDAHLENGQYWNTCWECGKQFIGYKRRVVCKVCHKQATPTIIEGYKYR